MRPLPIMGHYAEGGVLGETTSLTLLPPHGGPINLCCGRAKWMIFSYFSEGIVPYVAADLVCQGWR